MTRRSPAPPFGHEPPVNEHLGSQDAQAASDGSHDAQLSRSARLLVESPHRTHFIGEVSNGTFLANITDAVITESPEAFEHADTMFAQHRSQNVDLQVLQSAKEGLPPQNIANFLVCVFFHVVEANYYYMDREEFKDKMKKVYLDRSPASSDPSSICLCLIVLAMGSQFAEVHGASGARPSRKVSESGPGLGFYLKAKSLIPDVITQCSLEGIQACFLMGLFLLPSNTSDLAYVFHGIALKMAISGGLHRRVGGTLLDKKTIQVRARLWWSLFTSERRLTIILDRPQSIHEDDIDAPLPEFSAELDLPPLTDNIENLRASIELTRLFNQAVRLVKTSRQQTHDLATAAFQDIKDRLETWSKNLPQCLQLRNLNEPNSPVFRGAIHLHMNRNQIMTYLGRGFLLKRFKAHVGRQHANDVSTEAVHAVDARERSIINDCVSAAFRTVDLVEYLWSHHKLARFSFTDLNCCSSAALIIMINEITQQHPMYRSAMNTVTQAMEFMATGCWNAGQSLKLIQDLQRATDSLKSRSSHRTAQQVRAQEYGFDSWDRWIAAGRPSSITASHDEHQPFSANTIPQSGDVQHEWSEGDGEDMYEPASQMEDRSAEYSAWSQDDNEMLDVFYSMWPESLDPLGLSVFEDFAVPA